MNSPTKTNYAPVNGISMYYEVYGDGNIPLVLIHGGGSTIQTTFGNILHLLPGKLIAVELQAHGRTTDRTSGESFDQDADDVAGLLAYLGISKANFLGFSNGGTTTLYIAKKYPQLVNKIVAASPLYKRDGVIAGMFDGLQQATLADMPEALKTGFLAVNPDKEKLQTMFNKDRERMLGFTDMPDSDLETITAPTLLIVADRDVITVEHLVKMCNLIPNARLVVLPGTHGSYIGTVESDLLQSSRMPEISAILIKEFLEI